MGFQDEGLVTLSQKQGNHMEMHGNFKLSDLQVLGLSVCKVTQGWARTSETEARSLTLLSR